ncbi:M23 family metallopeptidase [Micromonospora sp. WMMD882]|uniref:murein hydrolase activator EnvC family protein n=1 Tax=Micromonospora sp. WMMD882 TaxID=3015151 RepID=UPI00248B3077|nr:M23 family metallopeptidase [Micromonospora sp. WMMD882]WBB82377.1 M23 family metallopeptidase [Micromonospora sp. WMMD882]
MLLAAPCPPGAVARPPAGAAVVSSAPATVPGPAAARAAPPRLPTVSTGPPAVPVGLLAVPLAGTIRAVSGAPRSGAGWGFRWPLDVPAAPVRRFDPPPRPWLPGHRGVDLAAPVGARVRAAGDGVVLFAGMVAGRPVISVGHSDGLRTTYEPVRPAVRVGDRVGVGVPLGALAAGHPGCPASACLHWGLRQGTDYLDPLALLGAVPVRLLPVDPPAPVVPSGAGDDPPARPTG